MSTIESTPDFDALRQRVRATQHARSIPLLVIGALLVRLTIRAAVSPTTAMMRSAMSDALAETPTWWRVMVVVAVMSASLGCPFRDRTC